ncbi:MAG TPA: response regulator transcription factor [Gemmatimonadales bacterium]|nr:response regulator transcription factor [Gemmatimonadales bacterium]
MAEKITVLLADDHTLVRDGVRRILSAAGDMLVVAEVGDGEAAVQETVARHPDVAVLDITMPKGGGLEAARQIRARAPEVRILILSMHLQPEYLMESVRAGAHGYLVKDAASGELVQAVRQVCAGSSYYSPAVSQQLSELLRRKLEGEEVQNALERLSPREREVLRYIAEGATNKETAQALGISVRTVETHRDSLMRKVGIKTIAGLTRLALRSGLVSDDA